MAINDGGAAFPRPASTLPNRYGDDHLIDDQDGMTLRDYFAAKAMHAELNTAGAHPAPAKALAKAAEEAGQTICERIAYNAYRLADAMLIERTKDR